MYQVNNYGWICPVCGKGVAPWASTCPCKDFNYNITCCDSLQPVTSGWYKMDLQEGDINVTE